MVVAGMSLRVAAGSTAGGFCGGCEGLETGGGRAGAGCDNGLVRVWRH